MSSGRKTTAAVKSWLGYCSSHASAIWSQLRSRVLFFKTAAPLLPISRWFDSLREFLAAGPRSGHPLTEGVAVSFPNMKCSVCDSVFDIEAEGGIAGEFGICPVAFCPWCFASMVDMVQQGCYRCQEDELEDARAFLEENPPSIN